MHVWSSLNIVKLQFSSQQLCYVHSGITTNYGIHTVIMEKFEKPLQEWPHLP